MYLREDVERRLSVVQPRRGRFSVCLRDDGVLFPVVGLPTPIGVSVPDFPTREEAFGVGLRCLRDDEESTGGFGHLDVVVFDDHMHEVVNTH